MTHPTTRPTTPMTTACPTANRGATHPMTTKTAHEIGRAEAEGVAVSDVPYFVQNRIAVRLEGEDGVVVAALSHDAVAELRDLLEAHLEPRRTP